MFSWLKRRACSCSHELDDAVFDKLAGVLKRHNLRKIEYRDGRITVKMTSGEFVDFVGPRQHATQRVCDREVETEEEPASSGESTELDFSKHPGAFKSPVVGTCYLSPEPGAPPFVSVGADVQEGQPILIIEAMKVMNLIKAPKSGKVIHIAVSDSTPVEYGQLLAVIE
ncbi:MAG: hypothetical protein LBJ69_01215 [Holosporales bacterium]|jgi:acetyl-CoA carboxylase biotin carboxyl carrier protein|nr:hypothetical protein [Holosporales bacterium]